MADKWHKQVISLNGGEGKIDMAISKGNSNEELLEGAQWRSLNFLMQHAPLCGGIINLMDISKEKSVLHCQLCGLRIDVPAHIGTIGELVVYLTVHGQ